VSAPAGIAPPRRGPLAGPAAACGLGLGAAYALAILAATAVLLVAPRTAPVAPLDLGVSSVALQDIPPAYLRLYLAAAGRYGIDWSVLAAIGKVECDHGRDPDPACTREGAENGAGAGGPMQFLASTWATYGVDGEGDGRRDRWDPADAIFSAAHYLRASGAPGDERAAIFAYNHALWYVDLVLAWAARYRAAGAGLVAGDRATLTPGDGHVALAPATAPAAVQAMIAAGNELEDEPYGTGGHPDPRNAPSQDCSSTVSYVLWRAGLRSLEEILRDNPLAQSYPSYGLPGPGRWVTIYATAAPVAHVFIVIAGLRLDTSHRGTDVGPNRDQDGPRWRILDHIPTWAAWAVRHPPGL
jgi:Transglycosylase SLT domain